MINRVDKRTPIPREFRQSSYRGYPIVESYKYLGIEMDDSFNFKIELSEKKQKEKQIDAVWELVKETTEKLNITKISRNKILVDDEYVGEGYGIPNEGTIEAISLLAKKESILLDPVYSGKGMAGLINLIRIGTFKKDQKILFLHTGGSVALFAYERVLSI